MNKFVLVRKILSAAALAGSVLMSMAYAESVQASTNDDSSSCYISCYTQGAEFVGQMRVPGKLVGYRCQPTGYEDVSSYGKLDYKVIRLALAPEFTNLCNAKFDVCSDKEGGCWAHKYKLNQHVPHGGFPSST